MSETFDNDLHNYLNQPDEDQQPDEDFMRDLHNEKEYKPLDLFETLGKVLRP